jgi:hypothetical protein
MFFWSFPPWQNSPIYLFFRKVLKNASLTIYILSKLKIRVKMHQQHLVSPPTINWCPTIRDRINCSPNFPKGWTFSHTRVICDLNHQEQTTTSYSKNRIIMCFCSISTSPWQDTTSWEIKNKKHLPPSLTFWKKKLQTKSLFLCGLNPNTPEVHFSQNVLGRNETPKIHQKSNKIEIAPNNIFFALEVFTCYVIWRSTKWL